MAASPQTRELLEQFLAEARRASQTPDPGQVHDLRVAIRRFNQALAIFYPESRQTEKTRAALKGIMHLAGEVRDCDITLKLAAKHKASPRMLEKLRRRRGAAERALILALQEWMDTDAALRWEQRLVNARAAPASRASLVHVVKRFFKRGSAAEESDEKLHPLRIAAKKLRYTLELLHRGDVTHVDRIKELQTRLGDINDLQTAIRIVAEESGGKAFASSLAKKQEKKIASFHRYWSKQFAGRKKEWKRVTLQAAPSRSRRGRQGAA